MKIDNLIEDKGALWEICVDFTKIKKGGVDISDILKVLCSRCGMS